MTNFTDFSGVVFVIFVFACIFIFFILLFIWLKDDDNMKKEVSRKIKFVKNKPYAFCIMLIEYFIEHDTLSRRKFINMWNSLKEREEE